ncbi:hypothetical protein B0T10DRAFT_320393 [Thelonectria olida]|uniref:Uncharacterized protein n=1 Tax=Thelonectria olida TaxID=1576542 RepID=A0A9P9APZ9_9HYPO|nr:hypothetical protein B0T10DRAFT_320393 [Thelonectria olida]
MSNPPSTPAKVPNSAANYTSATLDPDLRSQINGILLRDGGVANIQEALLHALNSHNANWPTTIQDHALALLRSGEVTTFPALLHRVLEDVRRDSALNPSTSSTNGTSKAATNGDAKANGDAGSSKPSLALPQAVVEEALRVTRENLESICEIDDKNDS